MTKRPAHADKIMIVGIDGMDPKLTMKYMAEGKMPNTKRILERGVASKDLFMLGGMPTCTPPMWTSMATGVWPNVHGLTDFSRHAPEVHMGGVQVGMPPSMKKMCIRDRADIIVRLNVASFHDLFVNDRIQTAFAAVQ